MELAHHQVHHIIAAHRVLAIVVVRQAVLMILPHQVPLTVADRQVVNLLMFKFQIQITIQKEHQVATQVVRLVVRLLTELLLHQQLMCTEQPQRQAALTVIRTAQVAQPVWIHQLVSRNCYENKDQVIYYFTFVTRNKCLCSRGFKGTGRLSTEERENRLRPDNASSFNIDKDKINQLKQEQKDKEDQQKQQQQQQQQNRPNTSNFKPNNPQKQQSNTKNDLKTGDSYSSGSTSTYTSSSSSSSTYSSSTSTTTSDPYAPGIV